MKRIVLTAIGDITSLKLEEVDPPTPGPGEVRVRVCACGVCYRDIIDRKGGFPWIRTPVVPGHEIAGVVEAVGSGVVGLYPGDRVISLHRPVCGYCDFCIRGEENHCTNAWQSFGLTLDGGYAERVVAPASAWFKLEAPFSPIESAPLVCTFGTIWHAFFRVAHLRPGEKVLVTGGSGGVGSSAIQIASRIGCEVTAVTRSAKKARYLEEIGAGKVIIAPEGRFGEGIAPNFDLGVETVGEPTLPSLLRLIRPGGRVLLIGNVTLKPVSLRLGPLIVRGQGILGSDGCTRRDLQELIPFLIRTGIRPRIAQTFPLEEAGKAQLFLEEGRSEGRVVLSLQESW
jgi:D-arabinose 1-dehydrogenase-like Zn-dependent alcohol dehydrogenase